MCIVKGNRSELTEEGGVQQRNFSFERSASKIWLCLFGPISQPQPLENECSLRSQLTAGGRNWWTLHPPSWPRSKGDIAGADSLALFVLAANCALLCYSDLAGQICIAIAAPVGRGYTKNTVCHEHSSSVV